MQLQDVQHVLSRVRPGGCLQPYLEAFARELLESDYTALSTRDFLRSAAHFGRWIDTLRIGPDRLTDQTVARFARHRCTCPGAARHGHPPARRSVVRVERFVEHLRRRGIAAAGAAPPAREVPSVLRGFGAWLMRHRGLQQRTIDQYEARVGRMLPALGSDPARYDASLLRTVVLDEIQGRHPGYAKTFVTALRAFLRYLAAQGKCRPHLDRAIPTVRQWTLTEIPRYLEAEDVERVIGSCDLGVVRGVRDRAILLLLARLGLRAGDIVSLRVDDLDWDHGTVCVRGKGGREVRLPLPQDAGQAVAAYVGDARPACDDPRVFLCSNAPLRAFATASVVSGIVRSAIERAGIEDPPSKGAHLLRHSAATAMLRSGATLDAIATVLRHESADMTAHYAKVDLALLQSVAQPWPEGA